MDANQRREALAECLTQARQPVSATALAGRFSVSRQIIVGDIALLRAGGLEISATPRGYILPREESGLRRRVACVHDAAGMERELNIMVDNGCTVQDVVVEHPLYGQLTGELQLASRYDVQQFIKRVSTCEAHPLSLLTDGVHLHTLCCPDEEAYRRVVERLNEEGILYQSP